MEIIVELNIHQKDLADTYRRKEIQSTGIKSTDGLSTEP